MFHYVINAARYDKVREYYVVIQGNKELISSYLQSKWANVLIKNVVKSAFFIYVHSW